MAVHRFIAYTLWYEPRFDYPHKGLAASVQWPTFNGVTWSKCKCVEYCPVVNETVMLHLVYSAIQDLLMPDSGHLCECYTTDGS